MVHKIGTNSEGIFYWDSDTKHISLSREDHFFIIMDYQKFYPLISAELALYEYYTHDPTFRPYDSRKDDTSTH